MIHQGRYKVARSLALTVERNPCKAQDKPGNLYISNKKFISESITATKIDILHRSERKMKKEKV